MDVLAARWEAAHAASLGPIRALAASEPPSVAAAIARLPPGTLDRTALAAALAREAAEGDGAPQLELDRRLEEVREQRAFERE
jgi:hypothetical protein